MQQCPMVPLAAGIVVPVSLHAPLEDEEPPEINVAMGSMLTWDSVDWNIK